MSDAKCACPSDAALGRAPELTESSLVIEELPELSEKARIFPNTGFVQVDGRWWGKLSAVQRHAVLAHERAHDEDVEACEECADARAGAIMRHESIGERAAVDALASVVSSRHNAGANVLKGWRAADAMIKSKGSQNDPSMLMNQGKKLAPQQSAPPFPTPAPAASIYRLDRALDDGQSVEGEDPELEQSVGAPSSSSIPVNVRVAAPGVVAVTGGDVVRKNNPGASAPSSGGPSVSKNELAAVALALAAIIVVSVVLSRL